MGVEVVELELGTVNVYKKAVEFADGDDVGGELGSTPKLSALIMSAAYTLQLDGSRKKKWANRPSPLPHTQLLADEQLVLVEIY